MRKTTEIGRAVAAVVDEAAVDEAVVDVDYAIAAANVVAIVFAVAATFVSVAAFVAWRDEKFGRRNQKLAYEEFGYAEERAFVAAFATAAVAAA